MGLMEPLSAFPGTASSFIGFYTTLLGAPFGLVVGQAFNGTVLPLAFGHVGFSAACALVVFWTERGKGIDLSIQIRSFHDGGTETDAPGSARVNSPSRHRRLSFAVAAFCFLVGFTGRGLIESFVVFLLPLSTEFGLDRGSAVSIYALSVLATGIFGPFVGRLFDRAGPRTVYMGGVALLGLGLSLAAFATELWHLQVSLGVAAGLGAACLGNVSNATLLGRWFSARLTLVTSIVFSSFGIGMLVMVPVAQMSIDSLGWRSAYSWMGGVTLGLLIPLSVLPWREFGAGSPALANRKPTSGSVGRPWTISAAARDPAFWGLFAVYFFTSTAMFAIIVQAVAYLVAVGFPPLQAATAWGMSGLLLPAGMIIVGWLDGLIGRRPSVLLSYGLSAIGIGAMWLLARFPNVWLLSAFVICFGGMLGSRGPLVSSIATNLFRGPNAATIFGMITVGNGLGSALGSWAGGLLHDWTGSYEPVIAFAASSVVCAIIPFFAVPALRHSASSGKQ